MMVTNVDDRPATNRPDLIAAFSLVMDLDAFPGQMRRELKKVESK